MTPAGHCQHCKTECVDRRGTVVFPQYPQLADSLWWVCVDCGARIGSDEKGRPLGTAANEELRTGRDYVRTLFDPLWVGASQFYPEARREGDQAERMKALAIIKRTAHKRCREWLAEQLSIPPEEAGIDFLDLEQCRAAYRALKGVTYPTVREWAKAARQPPQAPGEGATG